MAVRVVTQPEPIVSLAEAKKHVRFSAPDDDDYIGALVAAVTGYLDGPDGVLGRALGAQVIEESRSDFPSGMFGACGGFGVLDDCLPAWCAHSSLFIVRCPPIIEVQSVTYVDETGAQQSMDVSKLAVDATSIEPGEDGWPCPRRRLGSVKVTYRAGYSPVPAPIRHAILLMVGTLYANREAAIDTAFAGAAASLLSPYQRVA